MQGVLKVSSPVRRERDPRGYSAVVKCVEPALLLHYGQSALCRHTVPRYVGGEEPGKLAGNLCVWRSQ